MEKAISDFDKYLSDFQFSSRNEKAAQFAMSLSGIMMASVNAATSQQIEAAVVCGKKYFGGFHDGSFQEIINKAKDPDYEGLSGFELYENEIDSLVDQFSQEDRFAIFLTLIQVEAAAPFHHDSKHLRKKIISILKIDQDVVVEDISRETDKYEFEIAPQINAWGEVIQNTPHRKKRKFDKRDFLIIPMQGVVLLIGGAIALLFVALILCGLAYAWPIGVMLILIIVIPILSYPMAIALWFMTNHIAFWPGFKELIWALFPLINITYVWEWWLPILIWVWEVARAYWSLL